jgi:TolA protein
MKLTSRKRLGLSGPDLALAVVLSLFFHLALVAAAFLLNFSAPQKLRVPLFYEVKLVGQPAEVAPSLAPNLSGGAAPLAPKEEPKPKAKKKMPAARKAASKASKTAPKATKAAAKKSAIPDLSLRKQAKQKPAKQEPEEAPQQAASKPVQGSEPVKTGENTEGVNELKSSEDFKFPSYLATIRSIIERNWNPPPGIRGIKAKVLFRVLRNGNVADARIQETSGNFYFDQAALRAIQLSSHFPPMPDGFYKEFEDLSVDLMEKE